MANDPHPVPSEPVRALEYYIVDVFSTSAPAGNPLAVVMDTAQLTTDQMQAIAREFNLSETTFVERRPAQVESAEGGRVRIFTTTEELPFAGHPTLGTASVLRLIAPECAAPDAGHRSIITLAENVGPIPVRFPDSGGLSPEAPHESAAPQVAEMTQRDPAFGPTLDPAEAARLCGLSVEDLDPSAPPQVVSTGTAFAIVLLRSLDSLGGLRVLQEEATA